MLTTPYVFSEADARKMAEAGADVIVCHLGLTTGGAIGAKTGRTLAECPALVDAWAEAALAINPDAMILVHGGPVAEPEDAEFILRIDQQLPWLLRRLLDGAPADREGDDRTDAEIQGDRLRAQARTGGDDAWARKPWEPSSCG